MPEKVLKVVATCKNCGRSLNRTEMKVKTYLNDRVECLCESCASNLYRDAVAGHMLYMVSPKHYRELIVFAATQKAVKE